MTRPSAWFPSDRLLMVTQLLELFLLPPSRKASVCVCGCVLGRRVGVKEGVEGEQRKVKVGSWGGWTEQVSEDVKDGGPHE